MGHCLCKDGLGLFISFCVYSLMLAANLLFTYTVGYPCFANLKESNLDCYIELPTFWFFWLMMVFSHMAVMCKDPGFIKESYKYRLEKFQKNIQPIIEDIYRL
jgi:hypothetical protein